MKLMTKEIEEKLVASVDREADGYKREIVVKYFHPMSRFTFFAFEGEKYNGDIIMYGYVLSPITPDFDEFGTVSLSELESVPMMERDLYLPEGTKLRDVL